MKKIVDISQTIVALATALGSGSIAVIRLSGKEAIKIVNSVFKGKDLTNVEPNTVHFGRIKNRDTEVDQVVVTVLHAPNSYTGENAVEISCHANAYIIQRIIKALVENGAKMAGPGEFTLRAFVNGKMDLSQAEAVTEIINAKSESALNNSLRQLEGELKNKILGLRKNLLDIISLIEIDLDFAEEEIQTITNNELKLKLDLIAGEIKVLVNSYKYAKIISDGLKLVIVGAPNVGKSTLMNRLLGEERVITSPIPGTTRDIIRENVFIGEVFFQLVDTAGIRTNAEEIEQEGIKKSYEQAASADLILYAIDCSIERLNDYLMEEFIKKFSTKIILVANKTDIKSTNFDHKYFSQKEFPIVEISALNNLGINNLKKVIADKIGLIYQKLPEELVITNSRHKEIFFKTECAIQRAIETLGRNIGFEFISIDLRDALDELSEITGETVTDDILSNIFSKFCIGK